MTIVFTQCPIACPPCGGPSCIVEQDRSYGTFTGETPPDTLPAPDEIFIVGPFNCTYPGTGCERVDSFWSALPDTAYTSSFHGEQITDAPKTVQAFISFTYTGTAPFTETRYSPALLVDCPVDGCAVLRVKAVTTYAWEFQGGTTWWAVARITMTQAPC